MATLTTTRGDVLTYTVTQTDTTTKVEISSVKVKKSTSSTSYIVWTVYLDDYVLHGQSLGYESTDRTISVSYSKTYTKPTDGSSSTVVLKFEVKNGSTTQNKTANVSVPSRTSYNVTFNANSGTGAPSTQKKYHNVALTLSNTKPTRLNYDFKRWNTATTDDGAHAYSAGGTVASTVNQALTLYAIWNPHIQYNANYGNGAPATATKTYGSAFTVSSVVPTRDGYTFAGWNTAANGSGTAYASGGTIPASMNTATTLYAQWTKNPVAPTISSLTVIRANSSGTQDDGGTYCKVSAQWSIDTTNDANNTATVTGTIKPDGGSTSSITFTGGSSGTSGTATALIANCDTDKQYVVTITVTDAHASTSRTNIMTRAAFILDLKAGGNAMGIGVASPSSGLGIGWATQFDEAVTMLKTLGVTGNLTVGGTITADQFNMVDADSNIATAGTNWTIKSQYAHTIGKFVMVCLTLRSSNAVSADTACGTIATLASGYRPKRIQGFGNYYGSGQVTTGGAVSFRPTVALTTTTDVVVGLCFMKS